MFWFVFYAMFVVVIFCGLCCISIIKNLIVMIISSIVIVITKLLNILLYGRHRTDYDYSKYESYYNTKVKKKKRNTYADDKAFKMGQLISNYPFADSYLITKYRKEFDNLSLDEIEELEDQIIESNNKNRPLYNNEYFNKYYN